MEERNGRSVRWLLGAYVAFSTVGALVGGIGFHLAGESLETPAFLAPFIGGVAVIPRALREGQRAGRDA